MSYRDYNERWEFKNGDAYYIPQSKSYKEILKGGLPISELTHNYLSEGNQSVKQLERPLSRQAKWTLPSEETLDIESPIPRRKGKKDPKLQSYRNRKKPHQHWTRLRFQFPLWDVSKIPQEEEIIEKIHEIIDEEPVEDYHYWYYTRRLGTSRYLFMIYL